jgi:hypothetical protein
MSYVIVTILAILLATIVAVVGPYGVAAIIAVATANYALQTKGE